MKETEILYHSEEFLMNKWLPEDLQHKKITNKIRELAYQNCYAVIRHEKVVSRSVLRKWFGIGGYICPRREQIFRLAFAAQFTLETLQEYLKEGILEPGIQINDYREVLFIYGLEHGNSYQDCLDMILVFERHVNQDTVIQQRTHTKQLREFYNASHLLEREKFLVWMCEHAEYFKGYSRVALKHFMVLKAEIVEYVSEAAKIELKRRLDDLQFGTWAKENGLKKAEKEDIRKFIRNLSRRKAEYISKTEKNEISRLIRTAYLQKHTNSDLLKEVYPLPVKNMEIFAMDQKKLSQILGIAEQKEKEIRLSWALSCVSGMEDKRQPCPLWIGKMMERYQLSAVQTAGEAETYLEGCLKNQRQRCHLIKREDLLPLIHYVAQLRYERDNHSYDRQKAREEFIHLAKEILTDCQMTLLNENYKMDCLLLSSFTEAEMYSFADLMEEWMIDQRD